MLSMVATPGESRVCVTKGMRRAWAGSPRDCSLGLPTDPDVPVEEASGSSRWGIAVLHTTELFRGDTPVRHGVLGVVPLPAHNAAPPSLHGVRKAVPPIRHYYRGRATPCHPSRRASFPSLGDTTGRRVCPPSAPVAEPWIFLELVCRYLRPACSVEMAGSPKFLGNPRVLALFFDPGETSQAEWTRGCCPARPPRLTKTKAHGRTFRGSIARPLHWLSTLRRGSYPPTTQDSLPAAGQALPDGIGYPQGSNERFQVCGYPPFQSFLAQGQTEFQVNLKNSV